jgi:hypothetical protein
MLKDPGAEEVVEDSEDVDDDDDEEGDVDIDEKQFVGDSTLMDGLEEPAATDTVNIFLANKSAAVDVDCPRRLRRAATRRRARGDSSKLTVR